MRDPPAAEPVGETVDERSERRRYGGGIPSTRGGGERGLGEGERFGALHGEGCYVDAVAGLDAAEFLPQQIAEVAGVAAGGMGAGRQAGGAAVGAP